MTDPQPFDQFPDDSSIPAQHVQPSPGPWSLLPTFAGLDASAILDANGEAIAVALIAPGQSGLRAANARLLAAAPELLAAAKAAFDTLATGRHPVHPVNSLCPRCDVVGQLATAIRKATQW